MWKQRVIDVNLARYEAGIDEELDWGVLWECGYQENAARQGPGMPGPRT